MINFLLGFVTADLLVSLVLFFKKEIVLSLERNIILFSIVVDIFFIVFLLLIKYVKRKIRKT